MLKQDLVMKNPLRALEPEGGAQAASHRLGLVIARAGLGKTALLVQIALDTMLRGRRVVHVSIGQNLEKTKAWYQDLFKTLAADYHLEKAAEVHDEIMRNRMIMTFNATTFSGPRLEERLNDLVYQNIFKPDCVVIDGFDFSTATMADLQELRELTEAMGLHIWFSAVRRGDLPEETEQTGLFDTIILLRPESDGIALNIVKDETRGADPGLTLLLDPATFLLKEA